MDIPVYTDIIFDGSDEEPMELDFGTRKVTLSGEGSNRWLYVLLGDGWVRLWIDLHVCDGKHYAYITPADIGFTGSPDINRFKWLMFKLSSFAGKINRYSYLYTKDQLNGLFKSIVEMM